MAHSWYFLGNISQDTTNLHLSPGLLSSAPAWCRSPHIKKVDAALNNALRIIKACLKTIPVSFLPVLTAIFPAGVRQEAATLALKRKAQKLDWHIVDNTTTTAVPPSRLKSCHAYNRGPQEMLCSVLEDQSTSNWLAVSWEQEWESSGPLRIHCCIWTINMCM